MAIPLECTGCGKKLKVKDESAGKRVKCPECQAVVVVPKLDSTERGDGFPDESDTAAQPPHTPGDVPDGDYEDYDDNAPVSRRPVEKSEPGEKKKSSGPGMTNGRLKIMGGALLALLALLGLVGKFARLAGLGEFGKSSVTWQRFQSPQGGASIEMPGVAKLDPGQSKDSEAPVYSVKAPRFTCAFTCSAIPPEAARACDEPAAMQAYNNNMQLALGAMLPGSMFIWAKPVTLETAKGMEFRFVSRKQVNASRHYVTATHLIVAEFVCPLENEPTKERDQFFKSLQLVGGTAAAAGGSTPPVNEPNATATP